MPGVYVSFPFCAQKCTYCNFASGVHGAAAVEDYLRALAAEIASTQWQWTPETVYIGGGTPSTLAADVFPRLLDGVPGVERKEATIEAAPGSLSVEKVAAWRRSGINRVSLGVQSFVALELGRTGRRHTAETVAADVAMLREQGIGNFSIDLIAGLPGQTREGWRESLDWVERLEAPHVSVYMLEVDEDSRLGREILAGSPRYGARDVPEEARIVEHYEAAVERFAAAGLERYEISNFARPGFESIHNLKYWRLEPYLGFGADAHSFDGRVRRQNVEDPIEYIERWKQGRSPVLTQTEAVLEEERFFVGLRMMEGVEPTPGERQRHAAAIARGIERGLLEWESGRVRLTRRGVLLSNVVFEEFIR